MKFFTSVQYEQLLKNGSKHRKDHFPVVKIDTQNCTWLLTELDPENPNSAFGLCFPNDSFSTLKHINLDEISTIENSLYLKVDCDFKAIYPVNAYQSAEWFYGGFVSDEKSLAKFFDEPVKGMQLKFL